MNVYKINLDDSTTHNIFSIKTGDPDPINNPFDMEETIPEEPDHFY